MARLRNRCVALAAAIAAEAATGSIATVGASEFQSEYERSGGSCIGDSSQVQRLNETLRGSKLAHGEILGETSEGRPIIAFEVGPSDEPPILLMAGIHAGELEGSIALLHLVRDVAAGRSVADAHAWIIPYISPDGSADIGILNRPNQNGPSEAGFRVNAEGLNLNRDFVKAESVEIRSLLKLVSHKQPVLVADFHTTDGAVFSLDLGLHVPHSIWAGSDRARSLNKVRDTLLKALVRTLRGQHFEAEDYYPVLLDDTNPRKGLGDASPRMAYSDAYFSNTGRLGVLVEINAYAPLDRRLKVAYQTALALLGAAKAHGHEWAQATRAAQEDAAKSVPGSKEIELDWEQGDQVEKRDITFRGLTQRMSHVTGEMETIYEGDAPVRLTLPRYAMKARRWAEAPPAPGGYVVAAGFGPIVRPILDAHALRYREVEDNESFVEPEWFVTEKAGFEEVPEWPVSLFHELDLEGHRRVKVSGDWWKDPPKDALGRFRHATLVPIAQPGALLIMALFEPAGQDSIVAWGLVNSIWERHEYPERHRAVLLAEKALAAHPEFAQELVETKDGNERLERVLRKAHPELFRRVAWIPVLKIAGIAMAAKQ